MNEPTAPMMRPAMPERILEEATAQFVARGYHGVSMREIAEALGITKAALYYHFQDKEDLFLSILNGHLAQLEGLIDAAEAQAPSSRGQVCAFVQAVFTGLPAARRAIIRLANQDMDKVSPEARAAFRQHYEQRFTGRLERIMARGVAAGELRPVEPAMAVWALLGLMYPFMNQEAGGGDEAVASFICALFFEGVAPLSGEA